MASSIETTVESLWKARRFLDWVPGPKDAKGRMTGDWLPIAANWDIADDADRFIAELHAGLASEPAA